MSLLPVSGLLLTVREPSCEDELFVLETSAPAALATVELGSRVLSLENGAQVDWEHLPASDLAAAALGIRIAWIGDKLATDGTCSEAQCAKKVDVSFPLGAYLEHHRPEAVEGADELDETGWYQLSGTDVKFKVPTVGDLFSAWASPDSAAALQASCIDAPQVSAEQAEQIDEALSSLSPSLSGLVEGQCPECGSSLQLSFDPCSYVLAELRDLFSNVFFEIHLLARTYKWTETSIIGLPRSRRIRYAFLAAEESVTL